MFEHRSEQVLSPKRFIHRVARSVIVASALILGSLGIGMIGYHATDGLSWLDAFLNAAMILTGMGPVSPLVTPASKVFAGVYALFSGVAFLSTVAVLFAPVAHRILHQFHLESAHDTTD